MKAESREQRNQLAAELDAAMERLAELERKAYTGPYRAIWWLTKRE